MDTTTVKGLLTTDKDGIDANIQRVSKKIDEHFQHIRNSPIPLFSGVEFSITGLCNRKCVFCPRVDPKVYPNKKEHLPLALYDKILNELKELGFDGRISFAGFGEPLLHPQLAELVRMTRANLPNVLLEIISNGDFAKPKIVRELFDAGLSTLIISMYDGEHQIEHFTKVRAEAGVTEEQMLIRVRYKSMEEGYGITMSNRAGMVDLSKLGIAEAPSQLNHPCYYPHYRLMVEQDGDVLLCCHDWSKACVVGNLNKNTIFEVWTSELMHAVRKSLGIGDRSGTPCNGCNVMGTRMGGLHFQAWQDYYARENSTA